MPPRGVVDDAGASRAATGTGGARASQGQKRRILERARFSHRCLSATASRSSFNAVPFLRRMHAIGRRDSGLVPFPAPPRFRRTVAPLSAYLSCVTRAADRALLVGARQAPPLLGPEAPLAGSDGRGTTLAERGVAADAALLLAVLRSSLLLPMCDLSRIAVDSSCGAAAAREPRRYPNTCLFSCWLSHPLSSQVRTISAQPHGDLDVAPGFPSRPFPFYHIAFPGPRR